MAITAAALQAVLGTNPNSPQVIRHDAKADGTYQHWYVTGGVGYPGRTRWVRTTAAGNAAAQAAEVVTGLKA
jgi:hypothetical protein